MGLANSKGTHKRVDESTSNSSLSNLRYVITERPKWKVFKKREVVPIPAYQTCLKPNKGCPCGNKGPCKKKVTPKGVTIHYPQKKKHFSSFGPKCGKTPSKLDTRGFYSTSPKGRTKVKVIKPKKFLTFRLDKMSYRSCFKRPVIIRPRPYQSS